MNSIEKTVALAANDFSTTDLYVSPDSLRSIRTKPPTRLPRARTGMNVHDFEVMASYAIPVINYIRETEPHIAVGCDRGARLFCLAIHSMWQEAYQNEAFPTLDGRIHFARLSNTSAQIDDNFSRLQTRIDTIVDTALTDGRMRGNDVGAECLRILYIDDWIGSGATMELAEKLSSKHDAETHFAVMHGSNDLKSADVEGRTPDSSPLTRRWTDSPSRIGIDYREIDQPVRCQAPAAHANRVMIHMATKNVAKIVEQRPKNNTAL